jgi:phosphoribosylformylglycinamidine synthase
MIVGVIEGKENIITLPFKEAGNEIMLVGKTKAELGGSEYHSVVHGIEGGTPPKVNEEEIQATWELFSELYENSLVKANHDVNKGGFLITIAEMCFENNLGASLDLSECAHDELTDEELLFSESFGRFIIEVESKNVDSVKELAAKHGVPIAHLGTLNTDSKITIKGLESQDLNLDIPKMKELYDSTIPDFMEI